MMRIQSNEFYRRAAAIAKNIPETETGVISTACCSWLVQCTVAIPSQMKSPGVVFMEQ